MSAVSLPHPVSGYEQVAPPKDIVLPKPMSPAESLAAIKVPAGFRVELVAAEPLVMDPIDMAWGPDGRIWVVEMADYPDGIDDNGQPGGRVRVLESTRGDGRYDKSTLFADGLNFPNSVVPWRKGVLVGAAPDVLYMEDTDGDGRADRIEKRFSGFGEGNQQHRANGLQWGLDGWLYMANGDSGGKITSAKMPQGLSIGRRDLRLRPDGGDIEVVAGHTQWGRNRDDWGNWFGGNNSNPVWHYALDDRYLARNPHLVAPSATVNVPAIPGPAPVFPASKSMARFNDAARLNHFTSACGTMVYRDDLLGADVAGNVFVCEPVHNLVHREILTPRGVTFAGRRASGEGASEFFASADNWARFTAARTGPDGALYLVDMYRLTIEHPKWIPEAWLKILGGIRAGSDKGRIYRVVREGVALREVPRLDRLDTAGLVAALESPNGTVRDLAQQALTWRADRAAVPALERLVANAPRPQTRLQALCTLDTMKALTAAVVEQALRDAHPAVLRHAVRLSEQFASNAHAALLRAVVALAGHADAGLWQQIAYTLGEWKLPAAGVALARLVRESDDPFVRAAAMSSAVPHAEVLLAGLDGAGDHRGLVDIAIATRHHAALARMLRATAAPRQPAYPPEQFTAFGDLLDGLQRNKLSLAALAADAGDAMKEATAAAAALLAAARTIALDPGAPVVQRVAALPLLGRDAARQADDEAALVALLVPQTPIDVQLAAVAALGRLDSKTVPERLLSGWSGYSPRVRAAAFDLLASRHAWTHALLERIEADRTILTQIDLGRRATLTGHSNERIAARASAIVNAGSSADRQEVIGRYADAMRTLQTDASRGGQVFTNLCSACHQFGTVPGRAIGPDLASIKDRSAEYLLTHILDPNRAVEDRYMLTSVGTNDGRTHSGMIAAEAGNSITLMGLDGSAQTILRTELKWITSGGRSLMPDGLEAAIDPQAMADLVAFLAGGGPRGKN